MAPWSLLVLATSVNLAHSVKLSYLEACGVLRYVAISRLKANIISTVFLLIALGLGAGLWSICVTPLVNAAWFSFWIYNHPSSQPYREERGYPALDSLSIKRIWAADIFPMQWKISLSWISGYLIFQLYTPVIFRHYGSIEAGRVGYTMTILTAILLVSTTFTNALAPRLAALFSSASFSEYNRIFNRSMRYSSIALFLLLSFSVILASISYAYGLPYSDRLLPPIEIAIFAASVFCTGIISCLSIYLRSQQKEPLLSNSLATAAAMTISVLVSSNYSITAILLSSLVIHSVSLAWAMKIFFDNRRSLILTPIEKGIHV
jgi:O-antigen/teichoic acid export membrane protein